MLTFGPGFFLGLTLRILVGEIYYAWFYLGLS